MVEACMNADKEKMEKIKHHNTQCTNVSIWSDMNGWTLISLRSDMVGDWRL